MAVPIPARVTGQQGMKVSRQTSEVSTASVSSFLGQSPSIDSVSAENSHAGTPRGKSFQSNGGHHSGNGASRSRTGSPHMQQRRPIPEVPVAGARSQKRTGSAKSFTKEGEVGIIAEAAAAVTSRDLAELRSFRRPPNPVREVVEVAAVLLGMDSKWTNIRRHLDNAFLQQLRLYDTSMMSRLQMDKLQRSYDAGALDEASVREVCPAAASVAGWCSAVYQACCNRKHVGGQQASPQHQTRRTPHKEQAQSPAPPPDLDLEGLVVSPPTVWTMSNAELSAVDDFIVSKDGVGEIRFHGKTDCRGVLHRLPQIVQLTHGEVIVYPDADGKPETGRALNRPASIVLYGCMPRTQGKLKDPVARERYRRKVAQMTEEKGAKFLDYDCEDGTWRFYVNHF